ncbi:polyphosphate kinase 1 [Sesbania bispinosa]|nr:polyphosphate kinase 1 [Sesbania bispinosa]
MLGISANRLVMKQRPGSGSGFSNNVKETWDVHVATPLMIFEVRKPSRLGPGHNPQKLLEERFITRDR